jgi:hypothetical protein
VAYQFECLLSWGRHRGYKPGIASNGSSAASSCGLALHILSLKILQARHVLCSLQQVRELDCQVSQYHACTCTLKCTGDLSESNHAKTTATDKLSCTSSFLVCHQHLKCAHGCHQAFEMLSHQNYFMLVGVIIIPYKDQALFSTR